MSLIDYAWTREETPEAVSYIKPGRKPLIYWRHEMVERVGIRWSADGASERQSEAMKSCQRVAEATKAYWDREGRDSVGRRFPRPTGLRRGHASVTPRL
jgi:hypothetical protein